MTSAARRVVFRFIESEMDRRVEKWGKQEHDNLTWLTMLAEEVGKAAQAILQDGDVNTEVFRIAAVAAAWLESKVWMYAPREVNND